MTIDKPGQEQRMVTDIHVLPTGDLREHDESAECWCRPKRDEDAPQVVVHNSMDQREAHERGERKVQ